MVYKLRSRQNRKMADDITVITTDPSEKNKKSSTEPPQRLSRLSLWYFLMDLLGMPDTDKLITWTEKDKLEFKIVDATEVAKLWGLLNGRSNMTYAKFSRAMRYYYGKGVLEKVPKKRYCYCFVHSPKTEFVMAQKLNINKDSLGNLTGTQDKSQSITEAPEEQNPSIPDCENSIEEPIAFIRSDSEEMEMEMETEKEEKHMVFSDEINFNSQFICTIYNMFSNDSTNSIISERDFMNGGNNSPISDDCFEQVNYMNDDLFGAAHFLSYEPSPAVEVKQSESMVDLESKSCSMNTYSNDNLPQLLSAAIRRSDSMENVSCDNETNCTPEENLMNNQPVFDIGIVKSDSSDSDDVFDYFSQVTEMKDDTTDDVDCLKINFDNETNSYRQQLNMNKIDFMNTNDLFTYFSESGNFTQTQGMNSFNDYNYILTGKKTGIRTKSDTFDGIEQVMNTEIDKILAVFYQEISRGTTFI